MPRAPVAEFPFYGERVAFPLHAQYMVLSTSHWMPLVNGYSDHIPQDFREAAAVLDSFPSNDSFAVLQRRRVRYIGVHWDYVRAARRRNPRAARAVQPAPASARERCRHDAVRDRLVPLTSRASATSVRGGLRRRVLRRRLLLLRWRLLFDAGLLRARASVPTPWPAPGGDGAERPACRRPNRTGAGNPRPCRESASHSSGSRETGCRR